MGGQCPRLGNWRIRWGCADELSAPLAVGGRLSSKDPQTSEAFGYIAAGLITPSGPVARSCPMSGIVWWIFFILACACLIGVALWIERKSGTRRGHG